MHMTSVPKEVMWTQPMGKNIVGEDVPGRTVILVCAHGHGGMYPLYESSNQPRQLNKPILLRWVYVQSKHVKALKYLAELVEPSLSCSLLGGHREEDCAEVPTSVLRWWFRTETQGGRRPGAWGSWR